ncbi:MAG TPA: carboxypeptidase regulatory-like domain-containing protein [Bryobacteraceae bacterium]
MVAILFCAAVSIFAQQANYSIAGIAVEQGTKQPLSRALMIIRTTDGSHREKACITNTNGAFRFDGIPPGKYILNGELPGKRPQPFHRSGQYVTGIAVGPGRDSEHIVFTFVRAGTIAGRVTGDDGTPVRYAHVYLLRDGVFAGREAIRMRGMRNTNASGRFDFDRLPPGTYFVAVTGQPWYTRYLPARASGDLDMAYPVTYYADVLDPASATPIELREGGRAKIQIVMHAVPAVHVQIAAQTNPPRRGSFFSAKERGPGGYPIGIDMRSARTQGHWDVSLAPGEYTVGLGSFSGPGRADFATKRISVQGSDAVVKDEPMSSVAGKVSFASAGRAPGIQVVVSRLSGRGRGTTLKPDGSFQIAGLSGGNYTVRLQNPGEFRLVQVAAKGAAYSAGVLKLTPGAQAQLALVAAPAESHVDGTALKDGKPFAGAMILLLPLDGKTDPYVGRDESDSDGTFSVLHVPNGRYELLAIDDGSDLAYRDPAVMARYRSGGQMVNVPLTKGHKLKVKVLSRTPGTRSSR